MGAAMGSNWVCLEDGDTEFDQIAVPWAEGTESCSRLEASQPATGSRSKVPDWHGNMPDVGVPASTATRADTWVMRREGHQVDGGARIYAALPARGACAKKLSSPLQVVPANAVPVEAAALHIAAASESSRRADAVLAMASPSRLGHAHLSGSRNASVLAASEDDTLSQEVLGTAAEERSSATAFADDTNADDAEQSRTSPLVRAEQLSPPAELLRQQAPTEACPESRPGESPRETTLRRAAPATTPTLQAAVQRADAHQVAAADVVRALPGETGEASLAAGEATVTREEEVSATEPSNPFPAKAVEPLSHAINDDEHAGVEMPSSTQAVPRGPSCVGAGAAQLRKDTRCSEATSASFDGTVPGDSSLEADIDVTIAAAAEAAALGVDQQTYMELFEDPSLMEFAYAGASQSAADPGSRAFSPEGNGDPTSRQSDPSSGQNGEASAVSLDASEASDMRLTSAASYPLGAEPPAWEDRVFIEQVVQRMFNCVGERELEKITSAFREWCSADANETI
eukprot:TRINITY_DN14442_c0_g1_i1.p1 TRINITY_DN14442_c0_g1~~TRINITY_DN14442_c0_g1_i1.p1  ORF type:complete len:515 (-),score=95.94 TRINITY_DN14442_c0_g1_i1:159-1703(-)